MDSVFVRIANPQAALAYRFFSCAGTTAYTVIRLSYGFHKTLTGKA
jgi:hypothetical protein